MVVIQVVRKPSGQPASGEKVYVSRDGSGFLDAGGVSEYKVTDFSGKVYFSKLKPCTGRVNVAGRDVYKGEIGELLIVQL